MATTPKRRGWRGREALVASRKLTNQLEEGDVGLAALVGVSLTETGTWPVASAMALVMACESIGTREYWF